MMTKEELAAKLNGREYGSEIDHREAETALSDGLVVVFGYSDDNVEFRGAIEDEVGAYGGADLKINRRGLIPEHDCNCQYCGYKSKNNAEIKALWCQDDHDGEQIPWLFETEIPHATFYVREDGKFFCRGIVFHINDLPE